MYRQKTNQALATAGEMARWVARVALSWCPAARVATLGAVLVAMLTVSFATAGRAADPMEERFSSGLTAIDRGRYEQAVEIFEAVAKDAEESVLRAESMYWQAFALQRLGGSRDLERALKLLERQRDLFPEEAEEGDAEELMARIEGELARLGNPDATRKILERAEEAEANELRLAALDALMHMNEDKAMPILQKILDNPEKNGVEMRKRAVFILSQQGGDDAASILYDVATSDSSPEVQGDAIFWLGQTSEAHALKALKKVLDTQRDPQLLKKAVFALSQVGTREAEDLLEGIALDPDAPLDVRGDAVFWLGQEMRDSSSMIGLYSKLDDPALKEKVIFTVAQQDDEDGYNWLLGLANDSSEPVELRKNAFFWVGQEAPIEMVLGFYDSIDDPEIREQALFAISQRDEAAAIDKLIDIAKNEEDPDLRRTAVFWLGQSSDDRALDALQEIIDP